MQQIQLPSDLSAKLSANDDPVELCDEAGQPKRVAVPINLFREMLRAWTDAGFDPDALDRARRDPGGMTTAEAIAHVERVAAKYRKS